MPWYQPAREAGKQFETGNASQKWISVGTGFVKSDSSTCRLRLIAKNVVASVLAFVGIAVFQSPALANNVAISTYPVFQLDDSAILMLAVFGGAMSFALLSAIWMIRQRTRMIEENNRLKISLSNLRATNDRNEALVKIPGQRVVVWAGQDGEPIVLEANGEDSEAAEEMTPVVAFGHWLNRESVSLLDPLVRDLRADARHFSTVVRNKSGNLYEAKGGTSGSFAFVRFTELDGEREELARLKAEHEDLMSTFDNIENLLQRLPMPVWIRKDGSALSWVNRAYADAVEAVSPADAVRKNLDLFDAGLRERIRENQMQARLVRETIPATVAGDRRRLEVFSVCSGESSVGMAIDRSDVELIQRKLDETSEGNAKVLDQIATAVAIFDGSKRLVFHNSGFQQLWKLDPGLLESNPGNGELLDAMRDAKLLPEHPDWRKWRDGQLEVYQAIEPREEWWHLLDGQTLRVVTTPRNEGGATWVFENVTERLALESNYNSLIRVQGETLDHLNDAVAVFGSDGKLRLFNPPLEHLWQCGDMVVAEGLHISRILKVWTENVSNQRDLEAILGQITGVSETREGQGGRIGMRNGNTLEYSVVPLPDGQAMLRLLDITATVEFEKALKERAEALEASDLLKSKFIQHVSYELRAPLTTISGFGELLSTPEIGDMNPKQAEYLDHINSSADILCALVDDILDLASIDAGTMRLNQEKVSFSDAVSNVQDAHATNIDNKGIRLAITSDESRDTLFADLDRLQQVLFKLVSNAINYSSDGGSVEISGQRVESHFEIRISDDGPGIPEEERDKIFDRFESQAAKGRRQGAGLGLSVARGFVELHGGRIFVEDGPKGGAAFVCIFPDAPQTPDMTSGELETASSKAA